MKYPLGLFLSLILSTPVFASGDTWATSENMEKYSCQFRLNDKHSAVHVKAVSASAAVTAVQASLATALLMEQGGYFGDSSKIEVACYKQ